jgi:ribosomal protein L7Ae-like RNA K-turn-binding protein
MVVAEEHVLALIGFALRARKAVLGREACKRAAQRGALRVLVVAADAGASAARDCLGHVAVPTVRLAADKRALGALAGRDTLAVLGITEPQLAAGICRTAAEGAV